MTPAEKVDIVVIGSGIGGLSAARMLAEFGQKKVLVLEQHYTPGGMTHEFTRKDYFQFGTGVHYLTRHPGSALNHLTDGRTSFQGLPDDYDILHFPDEEFAVPAGGELFRSRLKTRFPAEAEAIDRFFLAVGKASRGVLLRHIASAMSPRIRAAAMPIIEWLHPDTFRTIKDVVAKHFQNPTLRAIVSARWGLYGAPPSISAFGGQAIVALGGFMDGGSHPIGGPKELGRTIIEGLLHFGVEIRTRQRVRSIIVENGAATGVSLEDTRDNALYSVAASHVVSAIGVRNTAEILGNPFRDRWKSELARLPAEISALLLFIGFRSSPAELGLRGENHWFMPSYDDDEALHNAPGDGVLFASFSSINNAAARRHTAEVMQFVDPKTFSLWSGPAHGSRPPDYLRLKAVAAERILARLEKQWPGFRAIVEFFELGTPSSFETFQGSVHGSIYGLSNSPDRLRSPIASCRTDIAGLFLSGQDAAGPGIEAALWGGIMAANAILPGAQSRRMWKAVRTTLKRNREQHWSGYLEISQLERLAPSICRIRFAKTGGGEVPFRFRAGQYLKLALPMGGDVIERSYSISSSPHENEFVEILVRLEAGGLGSTFLHQDVSTGEAIRVSGPFGDFTLDLPPYSSSGEVLLIGGGVGLAPLLSILEDAAGANYLGPITLLASFRSEEDVFCVSRLKALEQRLPGLDVVVHITGSTTSKMGVTGRIHSASLRSHVQNLTSAHLCGPADMMRDLIGMMTDLGVRRDAIHTEAFVSSRTRVSRLEKARSVALAAEMAGITSFSIRFRGHGKVSCRPGQTILSAANDAGVPFGQSCHEGACGECRTRVVRGPFLTDSRGLLSAREAASGWVLACQTLPQGDTEIDQLDTRKPGFGPPINTQVPSVPEAIVPLG